MDERIIMLKQQIEGIQASLEKERINEKLFHRAAGLDESAEKARFEITELETDLQAFKEALSEKQDAKNEALAETMQALSAKMSEVLPEGGATFAITDEGLVIGWTKDRKFRPYHSLSGGELVQFNAALCNALMGECKEKVIVMEDAELDDANLENSLAHLSKLDAQILAISCHAPGKISKDWNVVTL